MRKTWHIVFAFVLIMAFVCAPSFASVGAKDDGTIVGAATDINFVGTTDTFDGGVYTHNAAQTTGDYTFQSNLIAIGRVSASSTMASSSTALYPSNLCFVAKGLGSAGGLDTTPGTHLGAGTPGQVLVLTINKLLTGGTWVIYPKDPITLAATSTTFTSITMDTANDVITLLYLNDTLGWTVIGNNGCTVVYFVFKSVGLATS